MPPLVPCTCVALPVVPGMCMPHRHGVVADEVVGGRRHRDGVVLHCVLLTMESVRVQCNATASSQRDGTGKP